MEDPGLDLSAALEGDPVRILWRPREVSEASGPGGSRGDTLPIDLDPPDHGDFLEELFRSKEAWIEVSYRDGRRGVRHWNAAGMSRTSNVIGNLRSRPDFRAGAWQERGIVAVRVSIVPPR